MNDQRSEVNEMRCYMNFVGCPCCGQNGVAVGKVEPIVKALPAAPVWGDAEGEKGWIGEQEAVFAKACGVYGRYPMRKVTSFLKDLLGQGVYVMRGDFYRWLSDMGYGKKHPKGSCYIATPRAVALGILEDNGRLDSAGIRITFMGQIFFARLLKEQARLGKARAVIQEQLLHELSD